MAKPVKYSLIIYKRDKLIYKTLTRKIRRIYQKLQASNYKHCRFYIKVTYPNPIYFNKGEDLSKKEAMNSLKCWSEKDLVDDYR